MADKKKKDGAAPVSAAEAVAPVEKPKTPPKFVKIPKLAKKNKSRVPRKQKKAQQKASLAAARK
jgi:hypothetical protein